ncbi:MAG TPA: M14 family zinc carboxypeptidase, partial [Vicinamibacterales bacterium]|nr:M14 family zinc carboxypeptidase [Vicinamibacterales bacterium]
MRKALLIVLIACLAAAAPSAQAPAALPASAGLQAPQDFFGHRMGADRELADWPSLQKYFENIAAASDRVELADAGPTTEGRRLIAAIVSSPQNIARLEEIRANALKLADPRTLDDASAAAIVERQPVIVAIGMSIHATEIAATQTAPELLHTLATSSDPQIAGVLDNLVLILFPSLNPDGHVLAVDWYRKWKGTEFEGTSMPWLYHKYVGHDINRDAFMMNMAENRSLSEFFYRRWHPQVLLTMHQMGPRGARYFVPPNTDPIDPNYDPLMWRTAGLLGHAMA